MKRDIQAERASLDQQLKEAQGYRNKLEVSEKDLDEFVWRVNWVMEHPAEFLLHTGNKQQRQANFSLVFEEFPTYQEILNGTPKLSQILALNEEFFDPQEDAKSHDVLNIPPLPNC